MKKTAAILWLVISIFLPSTSQATIVKDVCITEIKDVLTDLPAQGHTVAVFDWDKTISSKETKDDLRDLDPEHGTIAVINKLHEKGIQTMVLTARLAGYGLDHKDFSSGKLVKELIQEYVDSMKNTLAETNWMENGALKDHDLQETDLGSSKMLTMDHMAFAGGTFANKGHALSMLIDQDKFKDKPVNLLFIDNDCRKIEDVRGSFLNNRSINAYLYHYPKPTGNHLIDRSNGDLPCNKK
jgi:hypothetical protein